MRTLRQTLEGMTLAFDPAAAGGLEATLQFDVRGPEPGTYHLVIGGGRCSFGSGPAEGPDLTIATPSDVWIRISQGELTGREALLLGLYEVSGDPGLLLRMDELFRRDTDEALLPEPGVRPAGPIPLPGGSWLAVTFVPWIVLGVGGFLGNLGPYPVFTATTASAFLLVYRGTWGEQTWFEVGSLLGLGCILTATLVAPVWSVRWGALLMDFTLGSVWLSSLLPQRLPLTAEYSRWRYAPVLASHSSFLHVNRIITLAWGMAFVGSGWIELGTQWAAAVSPRGEAALVRTALQVAHVPLFALVVWLTRTMPRRARDLRIEDPEGVRHRVWRLAGTGALMAVAGLLITRAVP